MQECINCGHSFDEKVLDCPKCIELDTKNRPDLISVSAITAQLLTEKGSSSIDSNLGELWPKNDDVCFKLITQVEKKFDAKNKFHSYLSEDNSIKSVPHFLEGYIKEEIDFKQLITQLMAEIISSARGVGAHKITGGNILFMHYKSHDKGDLGQLLAIMVDKKDGFDFDAVSLVPRNTPHINLDALKQAALFDLTLFDEVYPKIPNRDTYLKFIKGNTSGNFFKSAFGCDERNTDNVKSIDELRRAISDFEEKNKLGASYYERAKNSFEILIAKAEKDKAPVSAQSLYDAIESHLPSDSHLKGTFANFVNTGGYQVNPHIEPTKNSVKSGRWVDIEAGDKSFLGKVVRTKVGKLGSGMPAEYEDGRLTLLITDPLQRKEFEKLIELTN
ncbi:nucleoid-associated protein [Pseudoalteromonas distincta]|uniref:nucleoid-associated protein n=1 Tax=Pseudoalteromonas distincta TaxID=77608 RepID=UPI0032189B89